MRCGGSFSPPPQSPHSPAKPRRCARALMHDVTRAAPVFPVRSPSIVTITSSRPPSRSLAHSRTFVALRRALTGFHSLSSLAVRYLSRVFPSSHPPTAQTHERLVDVGSAQGLGAQKLRAFGARVLALIQRCAATFVPTPPFSAHFPSAGCATTTAYAAPPSSADAAAAASGAPASARDAFATPSESAWPSLAPALRARRSASHRGGEHASAARGLPSAARRRAPPARSGLRRDVAAAAAPRERLPTVSWSPPSSPLLSPAPRRAPSATRRAVSSRPQIGAAFVSALQLHEDAAPPQRRSAPLKRHRALPLPVPTLPPPPPPPQLTTAYRHRGRGSPPRARRRKQHPARSP